MPSPFSNDQYWRFGCFSLDCKHQVLLKTVADREIQFRLSVAETRLLSLFLQEPNQVHHKDLLLQHGWANRPVSSGSLPVAITNLRRYLESQPVEVEIQTLPRQGYLLELKVAVVHQPAPDANQASLSVKTEAEADAELTAAASSSNAMVDIKDPAVAEPMRVAPSEETATPDAPASAWPVAKKGWLLNLAAMAVSLLMLLLLLRMLTDWVRIECIQSGTAQVCHSQLPSEKPLRPQNGYIGLQAGDIQKSVEIVKEAP